MISEKDPSPAGGRYWVRTSDLFGVNEGSAAGSDATDAADLAELSDGVGSGRIGTSDSDAPLTHSSDLPPAPTAIFHDLNAEQADGHRCIVCNADFMTGIPCVPVGFSATFRSQVFACEGTHAAAVGYVANPGEQMELQS